MANLLTSATLTLHAYRVGSVLIFTLLALLLAV